MHFTSFRGQQAMTLHSLLIGKDRKGCLHIACYADPHHPCQKYEPLCTAPSCAGAPQSLRIVI
eukprot:8256274-Pyramimonas_sp.AAC.1